MRVHGYTEELAKEILKRNECEPSIEKDIHSNTIEDETSEYSQLFIDDYIEEEIDTSQSISVSFPEVAILLLDCETTGNPDPRVVELFCYDIISHATFHHFVNPETSIHPIYGTGVHGYTIE